ncbi:dual specificity protein phosphatase 22-A isoform X2 [Gymnodraco acuticeps]|uniref:Dual specificity protein phosphatase 22-A isoform X2 n=1 Tax=Gymnodraco acuticeps TaxID=8218 RepID=A0A6P8T6L6_GYMAC|nr:dual specificity protein phosphatase 22-A isoform X2 [Gymnodraco acuticeps]
MGNGMNKVVDGLYLGNIRDAENRESLAKNGITHILSVYNNAKPVFEDKTYLCIQAADASNQNLSQHFKECISFIHECRLSGGSCLVHCWEECLSAVKAVRSFVGPNCGFQEQLQQYQTTQVSEYRSWLHSSFDPCPFNDQDQVVALLSQYTEQQESQRRRADRRRINQGVSALPSNPEDPQGSS